MRMFAAMPCPLSCMAVLSLRLAFPLAVAGIGPDLDSQLGRFLGRCLERRRNALRERAPRSRIVAHLNLAGRTHHAIRYLHGRRESTQSSESSKNPNHHFLPSTAATAV